MKKTIVLTMLSIWASIGQAQTAWLAPPEAESLKSPFDLKDEKTIGKGEKLFGNTCWTCHGEEGKGDGVAAEALDPQPSDLTSVASQAQSDGSFYWKITKGRGNMVGYEDALTDEQRWQLVAFIRSLGQEQD